MTLTYILNGTFPLMVDGYIFKNLQINKLNIPHKSWEDCQYQLPTVWTEEAVKLLPGVFQSEIKHYRNEYLKTVKAMRNRKMTLNEEMGESAKFRYFPDGHNTVDVSDILKDIESSEDNSYDYTLKASYEVHYDPMSDGYDDYDTFAIKLKLESDDPEFVEQPELKFDLTRYNQGKLESLLKLIDTVFDLGRNNSENSLLIYAKSIETSDLEIKNA